MVNALEMLTAHSMNNTYARKSDMAIISSSRPPLCRIDCVYSEILVALFNGALKATSMCFPQWISPVPQQDFRHHSSMRCRLMSVCHRFLVTARLFNEFGFDARTIGDYITKT